MGRIALTLFFVILSLGAGSARASWPFSGIPFLMAYCEQLNLARGQDPIAESAAESEGTISPENLLDRLVSFEEQLQIYAATVPRSAELMHEWTARTTHLWLAYTQLFERLSLAVFGDLAALAQDIANIEAELQVGLLESQQQPEAAPVEILATNGIPFISEFSGFRELSASQAYLIPNNNLFTEVTLMPNLLEELLGRRTSEIVRRDLFQALKNGVTRAVGARGVKLIRLNSRTMAVEVKTVKGEAGEFRIFGCREPGGRIVLHFLGYELRHNGDPQLDRLAGLCP